MKKYEYMIKNMSDKLFGPDLEAVLNQLGAQGWELVQIQPLSLPHGNYLNLTFKRQRER